MADKNGRYKKEMPSIDPVTLANKELLSSKEAAFFLDVSMAQLYKLSSSGKVPIYSPTGGKIYLRKSELEEWVVSKRRASIRDINGTATKLITLKK